MELIDSDSGYDANLGSEYQSVTVKHDGHIFDISKDDYGIHIMIDMKRCKHYSREAEVIIAKYINVNKLP